LQFAQILPYSNRLPSSLLHVKKHLERDQAAEMAVHGELIGKAESKASWMPLFSLSGLRKNALEQT